MSNEKMRCSFHLNTTCDSLFQEKIDLVRLHVKKFGNRWILCRYILIESELSTQLAAREFF